MTQSTKQPTLEDARAKIRELEELYGDDWNAYSTRLRIVLEIMHKQRDMRLTCEEMEAERRVHRLVEAALAKRIADGR